MAIEFNCPHCGRLLKTSDERAFAQAKCPACGDLIVVPSPPAVGGFAFAATSAGAPTFVPLSPVASASHAPPLGMAETAIFENSAPGWRDAPPCPFCGYDVDARALYCSACGGPLFPTTPPLEYARFWRRSAAFLIDFVVLLLAHSILSFATSNRSWMPDHLGFLLWLVYHAALESSRAGATIGKRAVGIAVCGSDGRRLSFARAAIRTLAKIASALICGVGFLMPLLTARRQALHDLLTDAVVIRK